MGAEAVVLGHAAPMNIDPHRALGARADAVAPVIQVAETAAGPTHHRNMDMPQCLHHILAVPVDIGNLAVLSYPDTFIYPAPQMLGELAIDMAVDFHAGL